MHPKCKSLCAGAALVLKILLGLMFIGSGVLKLIGIDTFEIYIYSFGFFSLPLSFLLARICIVGEIVLGVGLVANVFNRLMVTAALCVVTLFSCFLCYAALIGRSDSCQCFGSLVEITPTASLVKNAGLIILLLLVRKVRSWRWRPRWFVWVPVVLAVLVGVFCISVPDNWMFGPEEEILNYEKLGQAIEEGGELADAGLIEGKKLVAFFTPGCPFCKMARQKLTTMTERFDLPRESLVWVYPVKDSLHGIAPETFMEITYGQRPEVVLLEGGEKVKSYHYRNIDEKEIADFLGSR